MPYITERWPGGMLTNFVTIRKAVKKMTSIDKLMSDGTFSVLSKRERLQIERQRSKLDKMLGSISDMTRLPGALMIVDIKRESIAVLEAKKLGIPIFAIVDTNSDPDLVDFPIPGNDDASKSISLILDQLNTAVKDGLTDRKKDREEKKSSSKDEKDLKESSNVKMNN
jgi:small subunit ribosomal protein S2